MDPCVLFDCGFSARRRASPFGKLALGPACLPRGLVCFGACLFASVYGLFWGLFARFGGWGFHVAGCLLPHGGVAWRTSIWVHRFHT
jgi:hypothetical protein